MTHSDELNADTLSAPVRTCPTSNYYDELNARIHYIKDRLRPEGKLSYTSYPQLEDRKLDAKARVAIVQAEVAELDRFLTTHWDEINSHRAGTALIWPDWFEWMDHELAKIWRAHNELSAANEPNFHIRSPLESDDLQTFTHTRKRAANRPISPQVRVKPATRNSLWITLSILLVAMLLAGWSLEDLQTQASTTLATLLRAVHSPAITTQEER